MKIGGKKISWRQVLGGGKILVTGLIDAYSGDQIVSWRELVMIILEVAAYFELPVDTKGLKVPANLQEKLSKYL